MPDDIYLTFDDVLLKPKYSEVMSRNDVDCSIDFFDFRLQAPILSANMDSITGAEMCRAMDELGGLGFHHRFKNHTVILTEGLHRFVPSVGVKKDRWGHNPEKIIEDYYNAGLDIICIDVAHAHHKRIGDLIRWTKKECRGMRVVAGNVATKDGALFLAENGADCIKVGIGPGAVCSTRESTGHGVPQLSAIKEVASIKNYAYPYIKIIADGGIRCGGDVAKSIAAGAHFVMIGSLFAGSREAPGKVMRDKNNNFYKVYRGMSSHDAMEDWKDKKVAAEGISTTVPFRGKVRYIYNELVGHLRSAFSYSGAHNLEEFKEKCELIRVSAHNVKENSTRL